MTISNNNNNFILPANQVIDNIKRTPYYATINNYSPKNYKRHFINVVYQRPCLQNINMNDPPFNVEENINANRSIKKDNYINRRFYTEKYSESIISSSKIYKINSININNSNLNKLISQNVNYNYTNIGKISLYKFPEIRKQIDNNSKGYKNKDIFGYSRCFFWTRKNHYFKKLQGLIRRDLSLENILSVINSQYIIRNVLQEKNILDIDAYPNFFDKINNLNWRVDCSEIPFIGKIDDKREVANEIE